MNQPVLYSQINNLHLIKTKQFLDKYANLLRWRKDGADALIDIGSGNGDVLMNNVYPLMPKNFEVVVCSDISEKMVNYAKEQYYTKERTDFQVLDIATDVLPQQLCQRFDHVTSTFCLHWVQKLLKAFQNMYKLLRPGTGDCLHLVLSSFLSFDCFEILIKDLKWSKYMQNYESFIPAFYRCDDPAAEFCQQLKKAGFVDCQAENLQDEYIFQSRLDFFNFLKSVGVFFERMPSEHHEEFFEAMVKISKQMKLCQFIEDGDDYKVSVKFNYIMAYARKPESKTNGS